MKWLTSLAAVAALAFVVGPADAGKFNKKMSIGDACPKFSGLECADGKSCSLDDLKNKDVLVVCITCNHCPVAVAYEDRHIAFCKKHCGTDSKVAFVAINVNNNDADKLPKMKDRAKDKSFTFPYAYDPTQKIGRDLGATVTPEYFVFDKSRRLVYTGAFDDNMKADQVKDNYVEPVVRAVLNGLTPKTAETKPAGCGVQYEKAK